MNSFASIRKSLEVTQEVMAETLGVSQGNISFYERGQTVPPKVAAKLIGFARSKGKTITFDDLYAELVIESEAA